MQLGIDADFLASVDVVPLNLGFYVDIISLKCNLSGLFRPQSGSPSMNVSPPASASVPVTITTQNGEVNSASPRGSRKTLMPGLGLLNQISVISGRNLPEGDLESGRASSLDERLSTRIKASYANSSGRISDPASDNRTPDIHCKAQVTRRDARRDIGMLLSAAVARSRKAAKNSPSHWQYSTAQSQSDSKATKPLSAPEGRAGEAGQPGLRKRSTHPEASVETVNRTPVIDSSVLAAEGECAIPSQVVVGNVGLSEDGSRNGSSSQSVDWEKEVEDAADCAKFCEITDEDKKVVANYCRNANRQAWFNIGTLMPGRLRNVSSLGHSNDLTRLDPKVLGSFCLVSENIRDAILNSKGGSLKEESIECVLKFVCRYLEEADLRESLGSMVSFEHMVSTATILVEKYGREEETDKKLHQTIMNFIEVALEELEQRQPNDLHERKAGIIMGILLAAMHRHADRNHKIVVNCVAATSMAVTTLWAWSYLRPEMAVAAAVAVTAFTLFEYLNLAPSRKFEVNEVNLALNWATINPDNGLGFWFKDGIQYAKLANGMEGC